MDSMEDSQRRALKPPFQRRNKSVRVVLTSMPKKSRLRRPKLPLFGFMLSGSRGRSAYENRNDQMGSDSKNANEPFQFKSNDTRSLFRRHDLSSTHEKKETNKGRCLAESPVVPNMSESDVSLPDRQNNIDFSKSILVYEANDEEGDSILLEILTESSGTESIPQSVRLQEVLGDSWKAAKYATAPPDGVELSDVSNSSRSSPSSLQSIDSVERGKNPPTQRNNPDPCTQDTVLDCAEYSLKKLSETFWERKSRNYSPQNKNRQTMFNNFCWVHSTWENGNVDDEDEDGMLDTEQSREALRTMLNEAVKEGSSLVSTTLDSLRQVAVDLTEDPVTEDDESQSSNESGKYVSMGEVEMVSSIDNSIDSLEEKLHFDFPEPAELWHPSIDGTGRMFENPINGKAGKSDQGKEEEKWEAFQQMRNSKIALHQDASSAYWPSNVSEDYFQSEEDTSENEDTFSMSESFSEPAPNDPKLDFHDFIFQTGSDLRGTTRKLGREIGYVLSEASNVGFTTTDNTTTCSTPDLDAELAPRDKMDRESSASKMGEIAMEFLTVLRSDLSGAPESNQKETTKGDDSSYESLVFRITNNAVPFQSETIGTGPSLEVPGKFISI